jgi:DNA-binding winged helix-turn-helix (wHTH) protein
VADCGQLDQEAEYLVSMGWIEPALISPKWQLSIPIFNQYLYTQIATGAGRVTCQDSEIYVDQVPVTGYFSKEEKKALRYLVSTEGIIRRDKLAIQIWNSDIFSDAALDQLVKRLRTKLNRLGIRNQALHTIWKQGFRWVK